MRSGQPITNWGDEYYQSSLTAIKNFEFTNHVFQDGPALVSRPDGSGWKSGTPYRGQEFDPAKADVVEGAWDHDHCYVCGWRLESGDSYWANRDGVTLCDVCHDYVAANPKPEQQGPIK